MFFRVKFEKKTIFGLLFALFIAAQLALASNHTNATNGTTNATVNASGGFEVNITANATAGNESGAPTPEPEKFLTTAERETGYYLEEGETYDLANFTSGGKEYFILKIGGQNKLVMDADYQPVTEEARVKQLSSDYAFTLPLPFKRSDFNSVKFEYSSVNDSWAKCRQVFDDFVTGRRTCIEQVTRKLQCWVIYTGDFGPVFNISAATPANRYHVQNGTAMVNASIEALEGQMTEMEAKLDDLKLDSLQAQLLLLQNNTKSLRDGYTRWNTGFSVLLTYAPFATDGGLNRCKFDKEALSNLEKAIAVTGEFPNPDSITAEIMSGIGSRYEKGQVKKLFKTIEKKLLQLKSRYDELNEEFNKVNGVEPTGLNALHQELSDLLNTAKTASNSSLAQEKVGEFNSKHKAYEDLLASSEASLSAYSESLEKINNATASINAAFKVYGQNDPRLLEMQKTVSELKAAFELKEADLRAGRPVTTTDFQSLASNASNLTATVVSLPRRENEIDLLLIVGLVVLIALIGGGIFFLKKYKQKQGL